MDKLTEKLTVYFEDPFWVGVFEKMEGNKLSVCKVTFGAEPKDYEIMDFILKKYFYLKFSPAVSTIVKERKVNIKRMLRDAKKQLQNTGIGTKSQQALKLQQEQMKTERKTVSKEMKLIEQERQFQIKQQKHKEKHKGR